MKQTSRIALWALLCFAVLAAGCFLKRQLQIDDCLDGGGRWNYETSECESDSP